MSVTFKIGNLGNLINNIAQILIEHNGN